MSAEFFVNFADSDWEANHKEEISAHLKRLGSYAKVSGNEIWLRGTENTPAQRRSYDVRVFLQPDNRLLLEISAHPKSIEEDVNKFLTWLRSNTSIQVVDVDGELSGW